MTVSPHLRGIVIAGVLAAVALGLGFVTLGMNQSSSSAAPHKVLSLKERGLASAKTPTSAAKPAAKPVKKPVKKVVPNANLVAALRAGLPRSVARGLAAHRVTVVSLTTAHDSVAGLATQEARAGAASAGASFVTVSVDRDGGEASALTAVLGKLSAAPATLVYVRPAKLYALLPGFNDRTVVQQAAHSAKAARASQPAAVDTAPAAT